MPPADLAARRLPLKTFRGLLFRIHRSSHACLHFSKDGSGRFDDPLGKFGVLYGAPRPETDRLFIDHVAQASGRPLVQVNFVEDIPR